MLLKKKHGSVFDVVCNKASQFLQISDNTTSRNILLSPEIKERRAILRDSEYLLQENGNSIVYNINGEELNKELSDLCANLTEMRKKFWMAHANGTYKLMTGFVT